MRIYADGAGHLLRVCRTAEEEAHYGVPETYAESLEIDPDTNPHIIRHVDVDWNDVRLSGGVLTYNGQPVTVNAPGAAGQARAEAEDARCRLLAAIGGAMADYDQAITHWDTLTQAQLKAVVRRNVEVLYQLLRYHRREVLDGS
jgi:hypothetical protein